MITKYLQENNLSSNVSMSVQVSKPHTFYKTLKKEDDLHKRIEYTSLVNVCIHTNVRLQASVRWCYQLTRGLLLCYERPSHVLSEHLISLMKHVLVTFLALHFRMFWNGFRI